MNTAHMLISGSISRALFQLALPILCANVVQSLMGTVSAFWVGHYLGEGALAAVTNAQTMMFLLSGVALGIAMAATILVGQCMGVENVAGAKRVVSTGVMFFSALSLVLSVLGLAFATPLLTAMRTAPEVLPLAVPYMRLMLLALPGVYMFAFVMSLLIGIGDATTPMRFALLSAIIAAVLTPAFMFGGDALFGAGVVGVGFATLVAQIAGLVGLVRHLYRRRHPLRLTQQDVAILRVDWSIVREIVRKGTPMGMQVLVVSLSSVLMISLVNRFGVDTTAAYGAVIQLWNYILMPALAIAFAVATIAAQNIGAKNWDRVKHAARIGMGYSFVVTSLIVALIYAADIYAFRLFLPEGSAALPIASHINHIMTWSLIFMTIPHVLFVVMRAAGEVMVPLLVHVLSLLIVRYPLAAMLLERWQADAIWWSFAISAGIDVVLAMLYYHYGDWHRMERFQVSGGVPVAMRSKR